MSVPAWIVEFETSSLITREAAGISEPSRQSSRVRATKFREARAQVGGVYPGAVRVEHVLQELLGPKRAAQIVYTGEQFDAATALRLGLVNEVLPPDQVMTRAREIAAAIMAKPRTARRLTHALIQRPWQRRIVEDLRGGYAQQLLTNSR